MWPAKGLCYLQCSANPPCCNISGQYKHSPSQVWCVLGKSPLHKGRLRNAVPCRCTGSGDGLPTFPYHKPLRASLSAEEFLYFNPATQNLDPGPMGCTPRTICQGLERHRRHPPHWIYTDIWLAWRTTFIIEDCGSCSLLRLHEGPMSQFSMPTSVIADIAAFVQSLYTHSTMMPTASASKSMAR